MDYNIASDLGEADVKKNFKEIQGRIVAANKKMLPKRDRSGQRAQHPKVHATIPASFTVLDLAPDDRALQVGLFKTPGARFKALIRLSNSSSFVDNPSKGGAHGMAIKIFDVEGEKFEPDPHPGDSFDLVLINNETFIGGTIQDYGKLNDLAGAWLNFRRNGRRRLAGLIAGARIFGLLRVVDPEFGKAVTSASDQFPISPLLETYFSTTPYLLGDDFAVKYVLRPVFGEDSAPYDDTPNANNIGIRDETYLTRRLRQDLLQRDHKFRLSVQVKTAKDKGFSIEDSQKAWTEAREVALAEIEIARYKSLSDPDWQRLRFGEEARSFNVWNVTSEHRPLGALNRLRREVYRELHRTRMDLDGDVYRRR